MFNPQHTEESSRWPLPMTRPLYWWMKGSQGREKLQLNICWQVFLAAGKICLHFKSFDQVGVISDMFDQKSILIELL